MEALWKRPNWEQYTGGQNMTGPIAKKMRRDFKPKDLAALIVKLDRM